MVKSTLQRSSLIKQQFGVPSLQISRAIDDSDKVSALHAAYLRYETRMRELETQLEAKAAELRAAYLFEVTEIQGDDAA